MEAVIHAELCGGMTVRRLCNICITPFFHLLRVE